MAESSGEKTEMPTPKKLRDARQKGQVCTSKDVVSTAILVVLFCVLGSMGGALTQDIDGESFFGIHKPFQIEPHTRYEESRN